MFRFKSGSWAISSKKDPRWNASGTSEIITLFDMAEEAKREIKHLTDKYGEAPDDLKYSAMKD